MKILPAGFNTQDFEKSVKNKWRWEWLNERDSHAEKLVEWLKKTWCFGYCILWILFQNNQLQIK